MDFDKSGINKVEIELIIISGNSTIFRAIPLNLPITDKACV